jgi:fatty-acid desaturase
MHHLTSLLKLLFVFGFLLGILCLAFFGFFVLLAVACVVSIILWAKTWRFHSRNMHAQHDTHSNSTAFEESMENGIVIEGEATEIKQP